MPQPSTTVRSRSTACGVGVALVLGVALIATGVSLTSAREADTSMDGAHVLRQARFTPRVETAQAAAQPAAAQPAAAAATTTRGAASASAPEQKHVAEQQAMQRAQEAAAASVLPPDVGGPGACLVSKWGAVWLVHPDKRTRSHVTHPTADCDLGASTVDDIERYRKAHGGEGAYALGEARSQAACKRPGCFAESTPKVPGSGAKALDAPPNGWGRGVAPGWQARANLRFNEQAARGFVASPPPPGEPLLLVFGGASVTDMLRNWALHAKELQMGYTVACMDQQLFDTAHKNDVPAAMVADDSQASRRATPPPR